jgi:hypothetical protein
VLRTRTTCGTEDDNVRLQISILFALSAVALFVLPGPAGADDDEPNALGYRSVMIGLSQVPPVASVGRGLASFLVTEDSATLYYSLQVLDVSSPISAAHIHLGHAAQNGEVVANLCGTGGAPACATQGVIATGTITSSNLVGPLAGHPLGDLILAMSSGGTYTNVHTSNFPDGEIRGQVLLVTTIGEPEFQNGQGNNQQGDNGNQQHDDQDNQDEGD